jgi:hypothetical protein
VSAHRWQETSPQGGEASRIVCVVCDVVQVVRYTTSGGYDDARYSFDGATWSTLRVDRRLA